MGLFALAFAAVGGIILLTSHAAGASANLWVDSGAGSCTRQATPGAYNAAQACGSLNAAFANSQSGDIVLVKCGSYSPQVINAVKTSGNVTFQSESSKCASFEGSGSSAITFSNKVGYITLDHFTINGQLLFSTTTGTGNNNISITNNDIDVGKKVNGPPISYSVGSNLNISHNTIGPSCCGYNGGSGWSPEGIRIGKPSTETATCTTQACNVTIDDNLIQYTTRDCQFWPASQYGACPDTTCTNAVGCHMDGIHVWGMDGGNITRNRLYGVECQGIYFENTNASLQRNINIVNNAISNIVGGCSNKGIYFSAGASGQSPDRGFAGTWNIAFNSGTSYIMGPGGCGSCQTGTQFNIVGNNMMLDVVDTNGNNAGCGAAVWGAATVNFSYNLWRPGSSGSTNQACGPNDVLASTPPAFVNEVNPPATGIDLHLASGNSQAIDFVPTSVCSAITNTDMDNDPRPQGAACDAGADEYVPSANVWVSATGNDTTCVRGDQTKPCATFLKAYQIAQCGDSIFISNGSYGPQTIGHANTGQNADAKDCSASNNPVIFKGESQNGVNINGSLAISEPWLTVDNVTAKGLYISGYDSTIGCYTNPVQHVTVSNTNIDGAAAVSNPMVMDNVQFITLSGDSIGNVTNGETEIHNGGSNCAVLNNHITITGTTFHDFINTNNGATHMECLQIDMGAANSSNSFYTISANKFINCGQYDIFTSGPQHDMIYQNNWFDNPCSNQGSGCSSLASTSMGPNPDGSGSFYNIAVTFNSYEGDAQWPTVNLTGTITGNIIAYNIFPTSALDGLTSRCGSNMNATRLDNYVNGNVTCAGDIKAAVTYVSPAPPTYDYDLAAGSAGIDALSPCPAGAPATDIHGNPRPQGAACDAGADEYVTGAVSTPAPTLTLTAAPGSITSGASSTLTWSSTNATSCTASGAWSGSKATAGSQSVSPTTSSTYTLACSGAGGSMTRSASISVTSGTTPPPSPPTTPTPPTSLKGDCDGDGHVTLIDLSILLRYYNQSYSSCDFDSSGKVDLLDLSALLSRYGS